MHFTYTAGLKDAYEQEDEDESYIGSFKAESPKYLNLTMIHPDFAMGYYFLGYGYANMGIIHRRQESLTWKSFIELTAASGDSGN